MHFFTLRKLLIGTFVVVALGWILVAMAMPTADLVEREFTILGPWVIYHAIPPRHRVAGHSRPVTATHADSAQSGG
jgi:hypothetical protein